ncbi:nitroreductase family protein [bacterium]|nr:nitroreductase family protein [bacterium]
MIKDCEIISAVKKRRSIRAYSDKKVEREKILCCIEAARLAPSAENIQPWRFLVLDDPEVKDDFLKQVTGGIYKHTKWAFSAPVIIIIIAETNILAHTIGGKLQRIPFHVLDLGIAGEHISLQAAELGLGTCWIGWFNRKKAQRELKLPGKFNVYSLMALGYPDTQKRSADRKFLPLEDIVAFNSPSNLKRRRR